MGLSFCFICLTEAELVPLITKTNDMSTIKIPHNGLPQEIANIPFGQVIVLTNPEQGITSNTTQQILAVISIAGKLNQSHIVYALPVQYSGLWGCYICKVKTEEGVQVLVSDRESVLEMLCEFWGLDFNEVSKSIKLSDRYERYVFLGGESHPVRIPVIAARKPEPEETEVNSPLLQCITDHTKEGEMAKIEDILEECALYGIVISPYELIGIQEKVSNKERKTYELDIDIIPWKEDWKEKVVKRTIDIIITDSAGIKHHITDLYPQSAALYLTFILFKDGIKIADLKNKTNNEFYNLFIHICKRLKSTNKLPDQKTLWKNANRKRGEIKKAISDVTNDDKNAERLFGIEGEVGKEFRVAGATDELREKIKKEFDIK